MTSRGRCGRNGIQAPRGHWPIMARIKFGKWYFWQCKKICTVRKIFLPAAQPLPPADPLPPPSETLLTPPPPPPVW